MGLTPLAGLPGATRSGSVDPRYVPTYSMSRFLARKALLGSTRTVWFSVCSLVFHMQPTLGNYRPRPRRRCTSRAPRKSSTRRGLEGPDGHHELRHHSRVLVLGPADEAGVGHPRWTGSAIMWADITCSLNGKVDALVFAGGIGEKERAFLGRDTEQAGCLGFAIDAS